jgi:phosphatidylglycerol---prolipoprotein diacylglyceryl transferase
MYPILGRYGPFFFYSYTAVLGTALLLALALVRAPARRSFGDHWWHGVTLALLAGLVAGRAGFVASHLDYFRVHAEESWQLWQGGLSYHTALAAGLIALLLWCRRHGCSFYSLAALLAPAALLWAAAGWFACWLEGCAYGREAPLGWTAAGLPDEFGVYAIRYQSQLLGVALTLLLALLIWRLRPRLPAGPYFWLALALASSSRALVSLWRGDPAPELAGWRLDTVLDGLLAAGAGGLFIAMSALRRSWRSVEVVNVSESRSGPDEPAPRRRRRQP